MIDMLKITDILEKAGMTEPRIDKLYQIGWQEELLAIPNFGEGSLKALDLLHEHFQNEQRWVYDLLTRVILGGHSVKNLIKTLEDEEVPLDKIAFPLNINAEKQVLEILDTLKPAGAPENYEKLVIVKKYKEGMTYNEIAEGLGVGRSKIDRLKTKAIRKLRHQSRRLLLEKILYDVED